MKAIDQLKEMYKQYWLDKRPGAPPELFTYPNFMGKSKQTNGLTQCIIAWIKLCGWQAERISSTGRMMDNTKIVTDTIGRVKQIGSKKWIRGTSQAGTADISATIQGRSVKIEVKNEETNDRMSAAQIEYKRQVEVAGGVYFVAHSLDEFVEWYRAEWLVNPMYKEVWKQIKM